MSSDSNIYIKTIETDSDLGSFDVVATFNPTDSTLTENIVTSLITPNPTKTGYDVSKTSFVVGSDRLDDDSSVTDKDTRMLFDKIKGAFRAGTVVSTQWDNASRGTNSTALGLNNIASGANSFASGTGNTASGSGTVAIGATNSASASNAVAIGNNNTSTAANTFTGGNACNATQSNAIAIGQYCNASGLNSVAIGYGTGSDEPAANTASGEGSVAIGNSNTASALNAVAIGESNISDGVKSFTFGTANSCTTTANNSIALGNGVLDGDPSNNNNVCGPYSISIGYCNNIGSISDPTKNFTDKSIVIGTSNTLTGLTGTQSTNSIILGSNCIVTNASYATAIGQYCKATGNNSFAIGYGTGTSDSALNRASATGAIAIGYKCQARTANSICMGYCASVDVEGIGDGQNELQKLNTFFWNGDSGSDPATYAYNNGSACFRIGDSGEFRVQTRSNLGAHIGSNTSHAWATNSDRNLKENLVEHDYNDTLAKIMDMPIYTYNFKILDPKITNIGPTAQDFNRLFPSGKSKLHISDNDKCGVALAGVKGVKLGLDSLSTDVNTRFDDLSENVDSRFASNSDTTSALQSRIAVLESSLVSASAQIAAMESRLAALEAP